MRGLLLWSAAILNRVAAVFRFKETPIPKPNKTRRVSGYIVHSRESKSGGWAMIKSQSGDVFFGHKKSFLNSPPHLRVGRKVLFTPLPPATGTMKRATEIQIMPPTKGSLSNLGQTKRPEQPASILVKHIDGRKQLVLKDGAGERVLSELTF